MGVMGIYSTFKSETHFQSVNLQLANSSNYADYLCWNLVYGRKGDSVLILYVVNKAL